MLKTQVSFRDRRLWHKTNRIEGGVVAGIWGHYQLVTRLHDPFGNLNVDRTMVHVARNKIFICIVNVFCNVFNYNVFVSLMYFEMSLILMYLYRQCIVIVF